MLQSYLPCSNQCNRPTTNTGVGAGISGDCLQRCSVDGTGANCRMAEATEQEQVLHEESASTELGRIRPVMSMTAQFKVIRYIPNTAGDYNLYSESSLKTFLIKVTMFF